MKTFIHSLPLLLAAALTLASCLSDNDSDTNTYGDMAITQFTLGTINRYTHTTSSKTGNDTIVKTTLTGANYKMAIDHLNRTIHNITELPVGSDIEHVVCTVSTKNSGVVAIQSMVSDSLKWYSSTDSISFAKPRIFRVYASDGSGYRDYTVTLHVSSDQGIDFAWTLQSTLDVESPGELRLVAVGDSIGITRRDSIIGMSTYEKYMMAGDGRLLCSRDNGITWTEEQLDDDSRLLPAPDATMVCWHYTPADNTDYVLLVGSPRHDEANTMRVWRKLAPHSGGGQWVYMPFDDDNHYPLTRISHPAMACYDGTVLLVGSDGVMRQSRDQGVTWRTAAAYALPADISGQVADMATDNKGRLWIVTGQGQLWMGTLK